MDATRLLLIEDDEKLCRLLQDYLAPLGYDVEMVHDGRDGLAKAQTGTHAAVILDVMLPGMSGFDILRELRRTSQVPVLMLTALGDEVDRIAGLEIGAETPEEIAISVVAEMIAAVTGIGYLLNMGGEQRRPDLVVVGMIVIAVVNALRGLAALWVAWYHVTGLLQPESNLLATLGRYGFMGVQVFFVVSGFVIPYALHRAHYQLPQYPRFLAKRLLRLHPPYLAVVATIALALPETREGLADKFSLELRSSTPEFMAERIRNEIPVWTKVMRAAGIEPE